MAAKNPGVNQSTTGPAMVSDERVRKAGEHAVVWATGGYTDTSRAFREGMRDTLAVLLGITTAPPMVSTDDAAALVLLGGRRRKATRAQVVHCECDGDAYSPGARQGWIETFRPGCTVQPRKAYQ